VESRRIEALVTSQFEFAIAQDHPALPGHFPAHPIVPGVLLLDRVMTGVEAALHRRVQTLQQVKFTAVLHPAETALVSFDAAGAQVRFGVTVLRDGASITLASGSLLLAEAASTP